MHLRPSRLRKPPGHLTTAAATALLISVAACGASNSGAAAPATGVATSPAGAGAASASPGGAASAGSGGAASAASGAQKVTYATLPSVALTPEVVAWQKGFYKNHGIDAQFKMFQSGATTTQALLAGSVDIAESGSVPFLNAAAHGAPLRAVLTSSLEGPASRDVGIYVPTSSGITSIRDLRGKTIAVNATGNMENMYLNLAILPGAGLSPKDVKIIEIPYANMQQVLDHGQVDAAAEFGPFAIKMNQDAALKKLAGLETYSPAAGYPLSLDVAKASFVDSKPNIIEAWRAATREGLDYMRAHPDEAAQLVSNYIHLPPALITTTVAAEQFDLSTGVTPAWTGLVTGLQKAGFIPNGLAIESYMAK